MKNRESELNQALEAMHFGFRAMVYKPDLRLDRLGFSRIHHRILYFIGRNPGCSIGELLRILGVSKQYLNRPLRVLVEKKYIKSQQDPTDRRIKQLDLTAKGKKLEHSLSGEQRRKFAEIFNKLGAEAESHWHQVMELLRGGRNL